MQPLRQRIRERLASARREPADWIDDEPCEPFVPLSRLGITAPEELVEYMEIAEDVECRREVAGLLGDGGCWVIAPVRTPPSLFRARSADEVLSPSTIVTFLAGAIPLGWDPDSDAFLIAEWGARRARSAVASFLFDDVSPADTEPRDFVLEAESLTDYFAGGGDPDLRPAASKIGDELARLYRRGIWVAELMHDSDHVFGLDDIVRAARDASPPSVYLAERGLFAERPHYAAYWLLSHALLGRSEALVDAVERAANVEHPAVVELCRTLGSGGEIASLLRALRPAPRMGWKPRDLDAIRAAAPAP